MKREYVYNVPNWISAGKYFNEFEWILPFQFIQIIKRKKYVYACTFIPKEIVRIEEMYIK